MKDEDDEFEDWEDEDDQMIMKNIGLQKIKLIK